MGDIHITRFRLLSCQLIFMLFVVGNIVSDVTYAIRV